MKRRRTFVLLFGLLVAALAAVVGAVLVRRAADARRLAAVIADLDRTDPGWRLDDIERARPDIPDTENSAVVIDAAFAKLVPSPQGLTDALDAVEHAVPPNVRLSSEQEEHLRNSLDRNAPAVPDLLALADRPRGRHVVAFTPGVVMTPLTHLTRVERVSARGLSPLAHLAVQDGDVPRALAAFRARLNLGRSLHGEPLPLSQAAHDIVQLHRAVRDLERLLGHATLSPEQLAAVRRELAAELVYDPWLVAARGQRAIADRAITALRDGTVKASTVKTIALGRYTPTATERVGEWFNDHVAIETDAAHAAALDLCTREVATAALPWSERLPAIKALDADRATAPGPARWNVCGSGWWRTRLVYDRAHLHCAIAAVAVEQYRVAHGDWPPSLTALGEPLPDDPYTGQPLRFERTADGVVVYSVGPNGRDDGGTLSPESADSSSSDGDIGFRLWDVPRRNRPAGVGKP